MRLRNLPAVQNNDSNNEQHNTVLPASTRRNKPRLRHTTKPLLYYHARRFKQRNLAENFNLKVSKYGLINSTYYCDDYCYSRPALMTCNLSAYGNVSTDYFYYSFYANYPDGVTQLLDRGELGNYRFAIDWGLFGSTNNTSPSSGNVLRKRRQPRSINNPILRRVNTIVHNRTNARKPNRPNRTRPASNIHSMESENLNGISKKRNTRNTRLFTNHTKHIRIFRKRGNLARHRIQRKHEQQRDNNRKQNTKRNRRLPKLVKQQPNKHCLLRRAVSSGFVCLQRVQTRHYPINRRVHVNNIKRFNLLNAT